MKLSAHIYFRRYLDDTVVCDTKYHKFYVMNAIAFDILEILSAGIRSGKDVVDKLIVQYSAELVEIEEACDSFISELQTLGMMESKESTLASTVSYDADYNDTDIEQDYIRQLATKKILYSALIELTYQCNLTCKHCYIINSKKTCQRRELNTQQIYDLLDELYDNNVFRIIFTGGEVFSRADFVEILEYAISKRFLVDIFSNGTRVSEETVRKIAKLNIRSFQCSLYGGNARIHDSFTGYNGSFDATVRTLKLFSSLGIATGIKSSFMKGNLSEYESIKAISKNIGSFFQPSFSIIPAIDGNKDAISLRVEDAKSISEIKELANYSKSDNVQKSLSGHICSAGLTGISINPYGDVYACNTLRIKIGSILDSSIKNIWNNSHELNMIRGLINKNRSQCIKCRYFNRCDFCPGIALAETGDMLSAYAEACTLAKAYNDVV